MSDNEYEEENLDDFMINASSILCESSSNSEKNMIIDTLKQHLSQIFHEQSEMQNFFNTLDGIIFTQNSDNEDNEESIKPQKISNKQPFKLYPIIFSFNPKTSYYYLDYFLNTLKKSISEENRGDFTYISLIFSEVIISFYSDEKTNKNILKKNLLLEPNKKIKLYEKILNFCNENINTNQKTEQSFGLLLLTEFIEKCPLIKEEKYLENIFKIISDYLDDRWFECKLDLLNCTISLIFTAETKFKPYAKICLFRVLDFLTDTEWMKRKLAINIVYTLVFYCKDEILSVKDNIIDFLNMLKEDTVEEVKDVCLQTLKFIEDNDPDAENEKNNINNDSFNNENNQPKNVFNRAKNKKDLNTKNKEKDKDKNSNATKNINNNDGSPEKIKNENEIVFNNNQIDLNNENFTPTINSILQQIKRIQEDQNKFINIINDIQQNVNSNFTSLNERIENLEKKAGIKNNNRNKNLNLNIKLEYNSNSYNDYLNNNLTNSNKEKEKEKEKEEEIEIKSNKGNEKNKNKRTLAMIKRDEQNKIEEIKKKFTDGKYNEALIESKENDKYLIKLLPLIDKNIIPKIEIAVIEDVISRLNKRLSIICLGRGRENISDILSLYVKITKSKINLKLMTQLSIKDTLKFLKAKSNNKFTQSDINNIEIILKALKV